MKLKYVYKDHPICTGREREILSLGMKQFFTTRGLWDWECDSALLAYDNKELIGFLRHDYDQVDRMLYGSGTYISADHRKKGLGFQMWSKVIKRYRPYSTQILTTSRAAEHLVDKLKRAFPKVYFI